MVTCASACDPLLTLMAPTLPVENVTLVSACDGNLLLDDDETG
jgi:hypothetical protein